MRTSIIILVILLLTACGHDLSQFQRLKNPEITVKTDQ